MHTNDVRYVFSHCFDVYELCQVINIQTIFISCELQLLYFHMKILLIFSIMISLLLFLAERKNRLLIKYPKV